MVHCAWLLHGGPSGRYSCGVSFSWPFRRFSYHLPCGWGWGYSAVYSAVGGIGVPLGVGVELLEVVVKDGFVLGARRQGNNTPHQIPAAGGGGGGSGYSAVRATSSAEPQGEDKQGPMPGCVSATVHCVNPNPITVHCVNPNPITVHCVNPNPNLACVLQPSEKEYLFLVPKEAHACGGEVGLTVALQCGGVGVNSGVTVRWGWS